MKPLLFLGSVAALALMLNACNKDTVTPDAASSARNAATTATDGKPGSLTAVTVASLPEKITTYIKTNYAGAAIKEAAKGANGDFVVVVTLNNIVKILAFKADGTFIRELAPKEGHGHGDTAKHPPLTDVAVASLPSSITTYVSTKYPGATIKKAGKDTKTNELVVFIMTADSKPVVLIFKADGTFVKEMAPKEGHAQGDTLHHKGDHAPLTDIAVASLPAKITTYITAQYPKATIKKAGKDTKTNEIVVFILTADNKRIVLIFAADGTFKKAVAGK